MCTHLCVRACVRVQGRGVGVIGNVENGYVGMDHARIREYVLQLHSGLVDVKLWLSCGATLLHWH